MKYKQLTIFDEFDRLDAEETSLTVNDRVRVKNPEEINSDLSVEDVYILNGFGGNKGKVVTVIEGKVTCYIVLLDSGETNYFYDRELVLLG